MLRTASLLLIALMCSVGMAQAQDAPGSSDTQGATPVSTYAVYLANFSMGRAVFMLYSRWPAWIWDRDIVRQVVCDLPSQSFFGSNSLFPQNACRIFVDVTHEWYLVARVIYPCQSGTEHCLGNTREFMTKVVHLSGLRAGAIYEYAACGEQGTVGYNCGWREIIQHDRTY
jgi:hypothetical protein